MLRQTGLHARYILADAVSCKVPTAIYMQGTRTPVDRFTCKVLADIVTCKVPTATVSTYKVHILQWTGSLARSLQMMQRRPPKDTFLFKVRHLHMFLLTGKTSELLCNLFFCKVKNQCFSGHVPYGK